MMMENGISMEYTDGYMEQEEEWEREGLLDPAWEKQQKKVCIPFSVPILRIKAVNNRLKVIISGLDVCGTQIVISTFFFEYFLDSPTSRQHHPKCECYADHSNFNKNQAPLPFVSRHRIVQSKRSAVQFAQAILPKSWSISRKTNLKITRIQTSIVLNYSLALNPLILLSCLNKFSQFFPLVETRALSTARLAFIM